MGGGRCDVVRPLGLGRVGRGSRTARSGYGSDALATLDEVDAAFAAGRVSYSKVRALTRVATPETQGELSELAEHVPAGRLGHALAAWQMRQETPEETESRQRAKMALWWHSDADGMAVIDGATPPG